MDHFGEQNLYTRPKTNSHTTAIRNEALNDDRIVNIINVVFQHQPAVFAKYAPSKFAITAGQTDNPEQIPLANGLPGSFTTNTIVAPR